MYMMDSNTWNGQDHNMSSTAHDDFQQFLDLGDMSGIDDSMQFDFSDLNASSGASMMHQSHRDGLDTPMTDSNMHTIVAHDNMAMANQVSPMTSAPSHHTMPSHSMPPQHIPNDAISEIDAQIHFLQHQKLQQQQRQLDEQQRRLQEQQAAFYGRPPQQRSIVPPTPQSLEMQAANQFYASHDHPHSAGMFDGYQQLKDQQDMAFTPLVSPAVTPLDTHFPMDPQFTIPGAYFSPITSPALHAQPDPSFLFDQRNSGQTNNSPAEMELESPSAAANVSSIAKEVRKSNAAKKKSKIRQSPITKPQRKKTSSTPVMNAHILSELTESAAEGSKGPPMPKSVSASSAEESDNASVSPEALEMPPPPLPMPRSARQSPFIQPQTSDKSAPLPIPKDLAGKPSPATPASLFRISPASKAADSSSFDYTSVDNIDNFELPESVNFSKPETASSHSQPTQPSIETGANKNPVIPLPSPGISNPPRPVSAGPSPQLTPKPSTPNLRKTPIMAPKGARKRPSISSSSPALLPKISPSLKPLIPGTPGLPAEDSTSHLLATKSNYQRILEGSKVPGLDYPSELSTNLTSKRTSHKIAEQGRRNRINSALQEIATLLPKSVRKELGEGDAESPDSDKKDNSKSSNGPNSKASTVESAIDYIKQLQGELAKANKRADDAEKKLQGRQSVQ
ncbi:helix-loop-helix DNA-binding domain-containing protein [Xylariaceae sp. FL0016]|nr:helix-loop-helix DNA-binding domain-containing protein [Xylariaceae sp. FL0016]